MELIFLTLAEVLEIHSDQISRYGGNPKIRDIELLESAVAMPYQTFAGKFLHKNLFEMAAAYAYHVSKNQPFMDGNKRTALAAALVFLEMNGIGLNDPEEKLLKAMHSLANKKLDKYGLAKIFKSLYELTITS